MISDTYLAGEPLRLLPGPQLLLDDVLVEDRFELERVLHHPTKMAANPILDRDKPWEGTAACRPQVIWDTELGMYRMWYQCANAESYQLKNAPAYYVGHAVSEDGIHWQKSTREDLPFGGYDATNIVYAGDAMIGDHRCGFSIGQAFRDERETDPNRRYKMVGLDGRPHPRYPKSVNTEPSIVCSPDGFHWHLTGERPILDHHSDTANHLVHDDLRDRWLLYCRPTVHASGRESDELLRHPRRRTSVMMSRDLQRWGYPRTVLYGDEQDLTDIDHCRVFRYGSHFLMLYAAVDGNNILRFHTRLASSADGVHWHRFHTREDFLPLGPEGSWDAGIIGPTCPPVVQGTNMLIYYSGGNVGQSEEFVARQPRNFSSGVAIMRADRFAAQRAGERKGYLITREFLLEGDSLTVNCLPDNRAYRSASLRVEIVQHPALGEHADAWYRERGHTYACEGFRLDDCVPVTGNAVRLPVRWKEHTLAELKGQPIYLRFELQNTDLFSFQID